MRTPYQHTEAASKGNAFHWDDGRPSIFCTAKDLGEQARKLGQMSAKGQANIAESADRLAHRMGKASTQPVFMRATPGAHHKGPRVNWATVKA